MLETLREMAIGFKPPRRDPADEVLLAYDAELAVKATRAQPDPIATFVAGGPAPMEPDLQSQQMGATIEPGQTRRPNVLPFTRDAQTGQMQLAMPRLLDVLGNMLPGAVPAAMLPPKVAAGEQVLGAGFLGLNPAQKAAIDEVLAGLKNQAIPTVPGTNQAKYKFEWVTDADYENWVKAKGKDSADKALLSDAALGVHDPQASLQAFVQAAEAPTLNVDVAGFNKFEQKPWTAADEAKEYPVAPVTLAKPKTGPLNLAGIEDYIENNAALLADESKALLDMATSGNTKAMDLYQKAEKKGLLHEEVVGPVAPEYLDTVASKRSKRLEYEDRFVGPPTPKYPDLIMDEPSRAQRAEDLGFTKKLFTGVPTWGENQAKAFRDPQAPFKPGVKKDEGGVFLADQPEIAEYYTGPQGPIMPVLARMTNPLEVDWLKAAPYASYDGGVMQAIIQAAKEGGHDWAIVKNIKDLGGHQTQYVALEPNRLRSPFARFDPRNLEANDLLASLALMVGGAAALGEQR